jgi:hypothetical protein
MTKTYGAGIRCAICDAQPWPDDPAIRESFNLTRSDDGWRCELHALPGKRARVSASPLAALAEVERLVMDEAAYSAIRRALGALRKTITPREPRKLKPIALSGDDPRQANLTEAAEAPP